MWLTAVRRIVRRPSVRCPLSLSVDIVHCPLSIVHCPLSVVRCPYSIVQHSHSILMSNPCFSAKSISSCRFRMKIFWILTFCSSRRVLFSKSRSAFFSARNLRRSSFASSSACLAARSSSVICFFGRPTGFFGIDSRSNFFCSRRRFRSALAARAAFSPFFRVLIFLGRLQYRSRPELP